MAALAVKNLKKSFIGPDGRTSLVVDIPEFELGAGVQMALRGVSGAGKTTFLNLVSGLYAADEGEPRARRHRRRLPPALTSFR